MSQQRMPVYRRLQRGFFSGVCLLALALLPLAGCTRGCQEPNPLPNSFLLAFSTDTLSPTGVGFRRAEIRSAYLVEYATATLQQPLDTLHPNTGRPGPGRFLEVYYGTGRQAPMFELRGAGRRADAQSFRLVVPAGGRRYNITNVVLEFATGPGKCPEYTVTRKEATVNGQRREALGEIPGLTK